jgi:DNA processing protein
MQDELLYLIAFASMQNLSTANKRKILAAYGSAKNIFEHCSVLPEWPLQEAEKELNFTTKHNIEILSILDPKYPSRLLQINDPPLLLFSKGHTNFNTPYSLSIVGTRQHTIHVFKVIEEIFEGIKHLPISIISGMALGIDGIAHQKALAHKIPTWGVLAHGLDQIYPTQHRNLAKQMLNVGGLLTECTTNTIPAAYQFPRRNRIVAGMSDATIVIESAIKGGSMITARLAFDYNREVFAVPGKIHDNKSKGCNSLIKDQKANLYFDAADFLMKMNWPILKDEKLNPIKPIEKKFANKDLQEVYQFIAYHGPVHINQLTEGLVQKEGLLPLLLLELELQGDIHIQAGHTYICI